MATTITTIPAKAGAPPGNVNAQRHGLRSGMLPRGCRHIQRATDELRQALEAAVLAAKGAIDLTDASAINVATRSERLACLAQRWLRLEAATMTHDQRLAYAREVVKASEQRDRAIRSLSLQTSAMDAVVRKLYGKDRRRDQ